MASRQAVVRKRLLNTSAPSREIGANRPPCFSAEARHAYSVRLPPMKPDGVSEFAALPPE